MSESGTTSFTKKLINANHILTFAMLFSQTAIITFLVILWRHNVLFVVTLLNTLIEINEGEFHSADLQYKADYMYLDF